MLATWYAHCSSTATARQDELAFNELAVQVFDEIDQRLPNSELSETNAMLRYSVDVARVNHLLDNAATINQALVHLGVVSRRAAQLNNAAEHAAVLYNAAIKLQQAARFPESSEVLRVSLGVDRAPSARARTASALAYNELCLGEPVKALEAATIAVESDEPIARYLFAKANIACAPTRNDIDVRAILETYARTVSSVDALALDLVAQAVAHCTPEDAAHYCAALRRRAHRVEQAKVISAHVAALLQRRPQSDDIVESGCRGVVQMRDSAADAANAAQLVDEATQLHDKVWTAAGARWRAGEFDAALELFELSEPLIAASDVEKRASAQRMIAACSVNLNMLDDAGKSLAIAKQLEAAGQSAPSAATTALEFRIQVKRGDAQGANATIKQIAALPLSGAERLEQLQLCAHVADVHGSRELCIAALTEALGACAAQPPLSADCVISFGTLLRMLVLEVVRNDTELNDIATVRSVARVFESAEPHLETHVSIDEAAWLAGAAWRFGRAALLHHASETAAVALFWSTSATLECRMVRSNTDSAAAHVDSAKMAATLALASAVEHAWKEDKHSRALIARIAVAEQRLASVADIGRANAVDGAGDAVLRLSGGAAARRHQCTDARRRCGTRRHVRQAARHDGERRARGATSRRWRFACCAST
jgi:tetratricopeptide (TPR) repeat protein